MSNIVFRDRVDAGQQLARALRSYANNPQVVVLGLPRGGVVLAVEIARELSLSLDIVVPRKIGAEGSPEYAIGAITESGEMVRSGADHAAANPEYVRRVVKEEQAEAARRLKTYRGARPPRDLQGKTAILVDDGVATGFTMLAAIKTAQTEGARKIVVAVPHGASESLETLKKEADEVVALSAPVPYLAVGQWYDSFPQTSDEEVIALMKEFSMTRKA